MLLKRPLEITYDNLEIAVLGAKCEKYKIRMCNKRRLQENMVWSIEKMNKNATEQASKTVLSLLQCAC